jgi:HTH-type transcriptional regulator/antitoxin HipB
MVTANPDTSRHASSVEARERNMGPQNDSLKSWLDHLTASDSAFKVKVEQRLSELRIHDELVKYRKKRGLSQSEMARIARLSQPYLAKLEAGELTNFELKTLVRAATALDLRVTLGFESTAPEDEPVTTGHS